MQPKMVPQNPRPPARPPVRGVRGAAASRKTPVCSINITVNSFLNTMNIPLRRLLGARVDPVERGPCPAHHRPRDQAQERAQDQEHDQEQYEAQDTDTAGLSVCKGVHGLSY